MYGNDYNYAESRLADSIVRIAKTGEPVYVEHVDNSGTVRVMLLKNNEYIYVDLDDLNFKPVPLGWCNTRAGATYLARIPKRRDWRQGIRAETCFSSKTRFHHIPRADLARCIRGEYPKLREILNFPIVGLRAWSRKWATDGKVLYFGNLGEVGKLDEGQPILDDGYIFLKESLEKSLS